MWALYELIGLGRSGPVCVKEIIPVSVEETEWKNESLALQWSS